MGDGEALAADVVEIEVIFRLHFLAQVLDGHVLLRQFHIKSAARVLDFRQPVALRTQRFVALRNLAILRILMTDQIGGLQRSPSRSIWRRSIWDCES